MRTAVLFSGGKDSTYSLHWALEQGHEVPYLITVVSERMDSYMYQTYGVGLTSLSAEAIGIERIVVEATGVKEEELGPLAEALGHLDIEGFVSGAIRSNYQRSRLDDIAVRLGLESLSPLWDTGMERVREMVEEGYEIMIVSAACMGMGPEWLGRVLDRDAIDELIALEREFQINPDGEGGEYETIVLNGPIFKRGVVIESFEKVWELDSGYIVVTDAHLE